jgi:hypothetical protein
MFIETWQIESGGIMKNRISRKEFIQIIGYGLVSAGSFSFLIQCSTKEKESAPKMNDNNTPKSTTDPCGDLTGLTGPEIEVRKNFDYVFKTPYPDKRCDNCKLWIAPVQNKLCGGCKIIKGPINPDGHCTAWVPVEG